jgi:hypothetical protein
MKTMLMLRRSALQYPAGGVLGVGTGDLHGALVGVLTVATQSRRALMEDDHAAKQTWAIIMPRAPDESTGQYPLVLKCKTSA